MDTRQPLLACTCTPISARTTSTETHVQHTADNQQAFTYAAKGSQVSNLIKQRLSSQLQASKCSPRRPRGTDVRHEVETPAPVTGHQGLPGWTWPTVYIAPGPSQLPDDMNGTNLTNELLPREEGLCSTTTLAC